MNDVVQASGTVTDATHQPNPNEQPPAAAPEPSPPNSESQIDERPEWLPEKFKTAEDMAASYVELEKKLSTKTEEIEDSLIKKTKAELEAAQMEGVPDDSTGYEVPEALNAEAAKDNPTWNHITKWAHERKLRQDDLNELVSLWIDTTAVNTDAEKEKLGEDYDSRANALGHWVAANVPEEHKAAIFSMANSADNFKALEALMRLTVPQDLPKASDEPTTSGPMTDEEARKIMASPAYLDPTARDPKVVKQIDEYFAAKYNTG